LLSRTLAPQQATPRGGAHRDRIPGGRACRHSGAWLRGGEARVCDAGRWPGLDLAVRGRHRQGSPPSPGRAVPSAGGELQAIAGGRGPAGPYSPFVGAAGGCPGPGREGHPRLRSRCSHRRGGAHAAHSGRLSAQTPVGAPDTGPPRAPRRPRLFRTGIAGQLPVSAGAPAGSGEGLGGPVGTGALRAPHGGGGQAPLRYPLRRCLAWGAGEAHHGRGGASDPPPLRRHAGGPAQWGHPGAGSGDSARRAGPEARAPCAGRVALDTFSGLWRT